MRLLLNELYNTERKEQFLSSYPTKSQITYKRVFEKSAHFEKQRSKDMSDFNSNDFQVMFEQVGFDYPTSARSFGRICTKYVDWAIANGYSNKTDNPLRQVKTKWFEQFVNEDATTFFTKDQIMKIESQCVNAQDAVIIRLLFEGVQGRAVSELRNLKRKDVDFETGILTLIDEDGSTRDLQVTERSIELINMALSQEEYTKSNSDNLPSNLVESTKLLSSDYVIRSSNTSKDKQSGVVDKFVIYRRIASIEKQQKLKHFTIKNIVRSGILKFVRDRLIEGQKIDSWMLMFIASDFKVKSSTLRDYVTTETINKLYGDSFR